MHDDEHVVGVYAESAQQPLYVLFVGGSVFQFKPVLAVASKSAGEENLVFGVFGHGSSAVLFGVVEDDCDSGLVFAPADEVAEFLAAFRVRLPQRHAELPSNREDLPAPLGPTMRFTPGLKATLAYS